MQKYNGEEWKELFGDELWRLLSETINTVIDLRGWEGLLQLPFVIVEKVLNILRRFLQVPFYNEIANDLKTLQNSQDYLEEISERFQNLVIKEPPSKFIPFEIKRYIRDACLDYIFGFFDSMVAMCGVAVERTMKEEFRRVENKDPSSIHTKNLCEWFKKRGYEIYLDSDVPHLITKIEYLDMLRHHPKNLPRNAVVNEPWTTIKELNKIFENKKRKSDINAKSKIKKTVLPKV